MRPLDKAHQLGGRARTIVENLQGTWGRNKGMCCCPAHDDHTPSLSVTLGRKAILFHCFAGCSNEDIIAALDRRGVRSRDLFGGSGSVESQPRRNLPFSPNARRLWQSATAITDSPAERYLAERGVMSASDQLRYLGRTPLGPRGAVEFLPAMLAAVTTDSGIIAIHRTFLESARARLAGFERPKRALGSLGYGAVRLAPPVQGRLGLAEGIESALSAMQLFGIPCWATLGNERFGLVAIPESVRELFLFIDNDAGGALAEEHALRAYASPVRGERRFISTIARRLDSLGALTRGQRQTGGQNLFDPADNLESIYAKEALHRWFCLLFTGKLEAVSLGRFQELTGLRIEAPDGSMVDDLPPIQRWLNRILALPIALQNAIFDEFMGLVEARIDAARQARSLDLGLETIAVEDFTVLSDTLLRTDASSGATTHLLELEIARALKPLTLKRLEELHGLTGQQQRPVRNARSGRVALLVPARSILADDGTRVSRFEFLRPLKRTHITEDQLAESSWEHIPVGEFGEAWDAEVEDARSSHKRERLYLATGLLLPVWDKLPSDFVRVSRISAADGRSLLGREVLVHCVPELCRALGLEREQTLSADDIVQTVLATGRAMEFAGREQIMVKRSLVNGSQRIELTGWGAPRLDWYKAHGCFTEIIRYQTRLFVPIEGAASVIARLASSS